MIKKSIMLSLLSFMSVSLTAQVSEPWSMYKSRTLAGMSRFDGWCTQEKAERMMDLILKTSPRLCVEVGVFGGSSFFPTVAALEYTNSGIAYGVDPWETKACLQGNDGANYDWWSHVDLEAILQRFLKNMRDQNLTHRFRVLRMTSKEAVSYFVADSIDIICIDGNHADESALFDAKNWLTKVRSGGYIWFDDADWPTTKKAVAFLMETCDLDPSSKMGDPYLLFRKR